VAVENFEERVLKIISLTVPAAFKKVKVSRESHLARDLGFDSFAFLALVDKFEEEFGVEVDTDEVNIATLRTVKDVLDLGRQVVEKGGA
jgi:acyl carrier protein